MEAQVSLISELNLLKESWIIKVCVIRLWTQPDFKNPNEAYAIEFVVVDEQGARIQGYLQKRWIGKFQHQLKEGSSIYIKDFAIADNPSKYRYCDNPYKLNFSYKTKITHCSTFNGSVNGISLCNYNSIWSQIIPENTTIDVVGDVITCAQLETLPDKKRKLSLQIQDLSGLKLYLTLWDEFADQMDDYVKSHTLRGHVVIVLQFAMVKWYHERPYVSNSFGVSKLYINASIDEITNFKNSLLADHGDDSNHQVTIVSTQSYSLHDDFLVTNEKKHIVEIGEINEVKTIIILGTIKCILKGNDSWYYIGCKKCTKKATTKYVIEDKQEEPGQVEEKNFFVCEKCSPDNEIDVLPRFRVPIRVQDSTGMVALNLFERDASKLLGLSANDLCDKYPNADADFFPLELNALCGKKFAFKIDITKWNLRMKATVNKENSYGISKITNDAQIMSTLEKMNAPILPSDSESLTLGISNIPLNDGSLKDAISYTGEVVTPSTVEKSTASSPPVKEKIKNCCSSPLKLKRKLDDVYCVDDEASMSTTKAKNKTIADNKAASNIKLLTPKKEK